MPLDFFFLQQQQQQQQKKQKTNNWDRREKALNPETLVCFTADD